MPTVSLPATTFTPEEKNEVFMKRLRTNTVKELEKDKRIYTSEISRQNNRQICEKNNTHACRN
jgi:hypothetical protein